MGEEERRYIEKEKLKHLNCSYPLSSKSAKVSLENTGLLVIIPVIPSYCWKNYSREERVGEKKREREEKRIIHCLHSLDGLLD